MRKAIFTASLLLLATLIVGTAIAQDLMVFPAQGQSEEQMEKDKFECYNWAKKQSGFDPMQIPQATAPPPQQQAGRGGALRGAAGGAVAGLAGAKIGGKSRSRGAKYGAAAGGVLGGASQAGRRQADQQAQQQWEQEQAANYLQNRNNYNRAYGACLEGKGYTVK